MRALSSVVGLVGLLAIALLATACHEKKPRPRTPAAPPPEPPLCGINTRSTSADISLAPATWFTLLLPGYRLSTGEVVRPVTDCAGRPVRWRSSAVECPDLEQDLAYRPSRPLVPEDLVITKLPDGRRLVWVKTDYLVDGQAEGPLAITEFTAHDLVVRALGTLRAPATRPRFSVVGMTTENMVVVEGDACPNGETESCWRGMRLLPLLERAFLADPIRRPDGSCVEGALLNLSRTEDVTRPHGRRRLTMAATVDVGKDSISIHEDVSVRELENGRPGKLLRQAQTERVIRLVGRRLTTQEPSLLARLLADTP